ncbi:non-hydrolyzing UDP-N-acetylglucosamine 2-epimerase [Polaribacter porphyrae]|uniref:UDP-N-acetylglucosamine 2-epimerase n=1 Tax=Polaribacter porphyrae TaxID=1137780 RepID=A0A2S7WJK5_9FLAO|nr:UDP-N-acetylglucosamine 2-epimerase (non-hydrolyzing) [Polaribacter porphyrae]PQJ77774.1 UDP-N-acetylglucosamine 2-epimerase [Polaribacter porphyrae]
MKIITVIGARPQIIKAAAISREILKNYSNKIEEIIVHTGQHYDQNMSEFFFDELNIPRPNYNLNVGSSSHGVQSGKMIEGIEEIIIKESPQFILLYGDTNSTLAGAVAASKINVPIVHIEAGLRSYNRKMPEEINRIVCDHLSTLLFSPTLTGYNNLIKEGFSVKKEKPFTPDNPWVFHCGDIMYDNSLHFAKISAKKSTILSKYNLVPNKFILSTIHRDHNTDVQENLESIFKALLTISKEYKIVLPLHPRTKNKLNEMEDKDLYNSIISNENLLLIPPTSFLDIIELEKSSKMVVTDSGGVQKEAYFFNKPCIILRPETEWLEILETGKAKLTSANYSDIIEAFNNFKSSKEEEFPKIFGNGKASQFICNKLFSNNKEL